MMVSNTNFSSNDKINYLSKFKKNSERKILTGGLFLLNTRRNLVVWGGILTNELQICASGYEDATPCCHAYGVFEPGFEHCRPYCNPAAGLPSLLCCLAEQVLVKNRQIIILAVFFRKIWMENNINLLQN
jgi:hypothetical protein